MQTYLVQGRYTSEAISNLIAKPEDRSKAVEKMCAACGGKLVAFYMSFGDHDFAAVCELPSDEVAAGMAMATASRGHINGFKTTRLLKPEEVQSALKHAHTAREHLAPPKGK
jgi:uncharacterized protein with GYD domain